MDLISKQAVDELERKFQVEKELLIGCSTNFGAFERVAARILPMFWKEGIIKDLVDAWDKQNRDATLLIQAYRELDAAYREIVEKKDLPSSFRDHAKQIIEFSSGKYDSKEQWFPGSWMGQLKGLCER